MSIGPAIKSLRAERGLTQQELARRTGMRQSVISLLESDNYNGHTMSSLKRIANACNVELSVEFVTHPLPDDDIIYAYPV